MLSHALPLRDCARMTSDDIGATDMNRIKLKQKALFGSANGNRTRRLAVQLSSVGSKWLCFQSSWYSAMFRNTATNRRRHSAVEARGALARLPRFGNCRSNFGMPCQGPAAEMTLARSYAQVATDRLARA